MCAIPITQRGKTPAYTVEDARAYISTQPNGHLITVSGAPFSIDAVEFVSRERAEYMMRGASLEGAVARGDLVCFARLAGPFAGQGISLMPGARIRRPPAHAILVFDAHFGRLIVEGFGN